jgi:ribosomal protein S18 acetylase RimI-like enzyme
MTEITIGTTADASVATLAEAAAVAWHNVAYDRLEPEVLPTAVSFADACRVHNMDLVQSVLAHDASGRIIGFAMLGRRGDRGWCGDFGVVPEWRGQGVGHRMMEAFIEQARAAGVRRVTLEVLCDNHPARQVYERAGYRPTRELVGLRADATKLAAGSGRDAEVSVRPGDPTALTDWFGREDARELPHWERQLPSLLAASNTRLLVALRDGREKALLVHRPAESFGRIMVVRIGLADGGKAADVGALLREAAADTEGAYFLIEEPVGSSVCDILLDLGFRELGRDFEMARAL